MIACSVSGPMSSSGSLSRLTITPSASANRNIAASSGSTRNASTPAAHLCSSASAEVRARPPSQLRQLGGDLVVALGERQHLVDHHRGGSVAEQLLEAPHERVEHALGVAGAADRLLEALDPDVGLAPHDLDQQPLLGAEVVVQQPA